VQDIAILTEKRYLNPDKRDWYVNNILTEDNLVQSELEGLGLKCARVAWDNNFNPTKFRFAIFRTTWNYFEKLEDFIHFLKTCKDQISFINPYHQIIWSLDKKYLLFLNNSGINIPRTRLVKRGECFDLLKFCDARGWGEIVIKPCISAAAWNTHHIEKIDSTAQILFNSLIKDQDMLIQLFQKNILRDGEISIMMINGEFSHAVLKKVKHGDFRVQDDFGGTVSSHNPSYIEIQFAKNVIQALPFSTVYARVDIVLDNDGVLALSELELIEPEMWFRYNQGAAKKMAETIFKKYFI